MDPAEEGVNINFFGDDGKLPDLLIPRLDLKNVPLTTALQYVCSLTGTRYRIEGRNIAILPGKE